MFNLFFVCFGNQNFDLRKENERIEVIKNDIEATKKEATKHMEQNESLEQFKQRLSEDLLRMNKQCKCRNVGLHIMLRSYFFNFSNLYYTATADDKAMRELTELNQKIDKYSMLISETESSLHQATVENHILDGNLKSLQREHERQVNNKIKQENEILELLQQQVTTDQASKRRGQRIRDMQSKRRDMELMMNNTEAQLSEILFEMEKLKGISARSRDYADDLIVTK